MRILNAPTIGLDRRCTVVAGRNVRFAAYRAPATAWIAVFCFSVVAVSLQIWSGAYRAELIAYPDESAHAVTGLAVEQYVVHGLPRSPVGFFSNYYQHYPKVAIGHWPPLLYLAEAGAMLAFSPSKYCLLGLQALFAGILAWLVFRELRPLTGALAASLGSVALLFNKQIQLHTSMTMAELLLTITMFLSCLGLARFVETRSPRDAVWFALWTTAAVWTKGTGWAMAIVVVVMMVAIHEWKLPFHRALRPAGLMMALLCVPCQIATMKLVVNGWDHSLPSLAFTWNAGIEYSGILITMPGAAMAIAALFGAVFTLSGRWSGERQRPYWIAMAGLVGAACLFNMLVPTGVEPRKVIMIVPPIFVLAAAGVARISAWISPRRQRRTAGIVFAAWRFSPWPCLFPSRPSRSLGLFR